MPRLKLFLPLVIFAVVISFFYMMVNRIDQGEYNPQYLPSALINKQFPVFSLQQLEQPSVQLTEANLLGKIALVNVWATWCPSCHTEHGYLNYLAKEQGVVIYGVNYKDTIPAAQRWLQTKGSPYQFNIFDPEGSLGLDMGVTGAPETYVLDHRGFVRFRFQGPLNETVWQEKFKPLINQLIAEQNSEKHSNKG
ncbi:MAG: DsbE family thiol:disulfide interchange protein [Spongiibacteraceae bacterium]